MRAGLEPYGRGVFGRWTTGSALAGTGRAPPGFEPGPAVPRLGAAGRGVSLADQGRPLPSLPRSVPLALPLSRTGLFSCPRVCLGGPSLGALGPSLPPPRVAGAIQADICRARARVPWQHGCRLVPRSPCTSPSGRGDRYRRRMHGASVQPYGRWMVSRYAATREWMDIGLWRGTVADPPVIADAKTPDELAKLLMVRVAQAEVDRGVDPGEVQIYFT